MTQSKQQNEEWEKEFDEKFPPFIGIGAQFPIFAENPNREHIKSFFQKSRIQAKKEERKEILEKIKKTPIDMAHTYASENADIYRSFDNGQESFKEKILSLIHSLLQKSR